MSRRETRPRADFWAVRLRDPLPAIPVPLNAGDADAALDLQAVLQKVYDAARYGSFIYDTPPEAALTPEDPAWAAQLLPAPLA